MPNTLRAVLAVLGAGVLLGVVAQAINRQAPLSAALPTIDPPATACARQVWPNVDRRCLSWTLARVPDPPPEGSESAGRAAPSVQRDVLGQLSVAQPLSTELQRRAHGVAQSSARQAARASARAQMRRQRLAERRREDWGRAAGFAFGGFDHSQVSSYAAETRPRYRGRPSSSQDAYYYSRRPSSRRPFSSMGWFN